MENIIKMMIDKAPTVVNRYYVHEGILYHAGFSYDITNLLQKIVGSASISISELPALANQFR